MTDQAENYSFRWGVDIFDNSATNVPNWILAYYHRVPWTLPDGKSGYGISNTEMMFIIHLSSFKYESPQGKAAPSLTGTIKERMNYQSNQGVINIAQGLLDKGLLLIEKQPGKPSVYDFTPFSRRVVEIARADMCDIEDANPSTKVDDSGNPPKTNPSTKLDDQSSTKLDDSKTKSSTKVDGSRQQKLTRRIKEEKEETRIKGQEKSGSVLSFSDPGDDPPKDDPTLWADVLEILKGRLTAPQFDQMLVGTEVLARSGPILTVRARSPDHLIRFERQLAKIVNRAAEVATDGAIQSVRFVGPAANGHQERDL